MLRIMGRSKATVKQLETYIKKVNPKVTDSVTKLAVIYIAEGEAEGVRGDIAFAQSCLETGNFTFSGSAVTLDQNNFCGLGVNKTGIKGNSFDTPAKGIRAQIQHLKAYACNQRLNQTCVDPRFLYVARGCAPYVEQLGIQENPKGQGWAAGKDYGKQIIEILNNIINTEGESDTMITITKMISKKNCYIGQNKPAYVVIHETDNWSKGADAKAHATAMKNGNLAGTVHYYVDSKSIYQTLDHSDGAWAVGDGKGKYGITNRNSINIEICVNPETDYYKAVDYAEQLAAKLLKQYGWGTDRLKRHYDASRKNCPRRIQAEGRWPEFVQKTAAYMKGTSTVNTKTNTTSNTAKKTVALTGKMEIQLPVIQKGSTGTAVSMLQAMLGVSVDGDFGPATDTSLKAFQKNVKISDDGICGEDTWKKVIEHMKANTK